MTRKLLISLLVFYSISVSAQFPTLTDKLSTMDGLPVANFGISANISQSGNLFNGIAINPGQLGKWLEFRGKAILSVKYNDEVYALPSYQKIENKRQFPISTVNYMNHTDIPVNISIKSWAPLKLNDHFTSAIPSIQIEVTLTNTSQEKKTIELHWKPDSLFSKELVAIENGGCSRYVCLLGNTKAQYSEHTIKYPIKIEANETRKVHFVISSHDKQWITAKTFHTALETAAYTLENWNSLYLATKAFDDALPLTKDNELNEILRWYTIPAIVLTKCTMNDEVLTMGYNELNQRDSYWTSWMHLVLFKDIEKIMIIESINSIKSNGKIPTTILPKIERNDDLDINAFFILRFFRYTKFYHDDAFAIKNWATIKAAMDWLISRDQDGDGLPEQVSFWGDWKDVQGVERRKYSPFSSLLYLSSLNSCREFAKHCDDQTAYNKYTNAYHKGYEKINTSFSDGGLWTGKCYQQKWYDHRDDGKILQDQVIGIFYDIVPKDKARLIFNTLNENNRTRFGIAETHPYYDETFGYQPGEYHNGAIWPWLSFMDVWSRLKSGRKNEAIQLIKDIAKADLFDSGDYMPNEHINSITGKNLGFFIQGWNAALFGIFFFELQE